MTDHPCSEALCAHVTRGSDLVEIVMLWILSTWVLVTFRTVALAQEHHMSHSLNSLKGGYIGDYYRGY